MTIPHDRIRGRRVSPPETPEEAELARELDEQVHIGRTMDSRLWLLLDTIETYGPEADLSDDPYKDPDPARSWDICRRNAQRVVAYFRMRRGRKVPARLNDAVAEIRTRLAAPAQRVVIPGSPWEQLRTILAKVPVFQRDEPKG
jgi:hypothetical protein